MNRVFKKLSFWNLYTQLERPDISEEQIEEWVNSLGD